MADGGWGAPGEPVLTRHQEAYADRFLRLHGESIDRIMSRVRTPHGEPPRQRGGRTAAQAMAQSAPHTPGGGGGGQANFGGHPSNVAPEVRRLIAVMQGHYPQLGVTSTTDHSRLTTTGNVSDHTTGHAVDLAADTGTMYRASEYVKRSGLYRSLKQGIHNPNLAVNAGQIQSPPGQFAGAVWGQHANHIHLAIVGALGAIGGGAGAGMGPGQIHLTAPRSRLGGVPGAMSTRAGQVYAAGLQRSVNRQLRRMGGGGLGGFSGGGAPSANMKLGRRMMLAAGWGPDQWPALRALWQGESGWDANARNASSGAAGIPQALGHGNVFALGDAPAQIRWGLNYIRERYGSPGAAYSAWQSRSPHWYSRGGRLDWGGAHREGGSFTTRAGRAAHFVAGEGGGREDVFVRPHRQRRRAARSSARGVTVEVRMGGVTINGGQDVEQLAEIVGKRAGKAVLAVLDRSGEVGDEELAG